MDLNAIETIVEAKMGDAKVWIIAHVWTAVLVAVFAGWLLGKAF